MCSVGKYLRKSIRQCFFVIVCKLLCMSKESVLRSWEMEALRNQPRALPSPSLLEFSLTFTVLSYKFMKILWSMLFLFEAAVTPLYWYAGARGHWSDTLRTRELALMSCALAFWGVRVSLFDSNANWASSEMAEAGVGGWSGSPSWCRDGGWEEAKTKD